MVESKTEKEEVNLEDEKNEILYDELEHIMFIETYIMFQCSMLLERGGVNLSCDTGFYSNLYIQEVSYIWDYGRSKLSQD